ncbi:MAG: hypothetical protein FJ335_03760 [Sphingomonadales bacterium]|nr:hypothetical protein [Sphingomonadales bacterium]
MALPVFPTRSFYFEGVDPDVEARTISGGVALSGEENLIATDGGGRAFVEFSNADLDDPAILAAWRAISARGPLPIIVPLGDARHQMMGEVTTPLERLPWWEEADFAGAPLASLASAAALRATTIAVAVGSLPKPVRAGIWLSIDHPTWRHRAYPVREVLSDNGATAVLKLGLPLREATSAGVAVEFVDPKCTMRRDGEMRSPVSGLYAEGSVRFVEYPGVPE